jgi:hypothetical protein
LAFLETIEGSATAKTDSNGMESAAQLSVHHILTSEPPRYERHFDSKDDPFAALYNLVNAKNGTNSS